MFSTLDSPAFDAGIPGGDRADFATPAGAGDQGRVGCTKTASQLRAMLLDLLRTDELRALAAILFDGQTQKEYAMQVGKSREWVKRRIHRASKKLSTAGVIITLPGKGRRARQRTHFVEPAAMNELAIDPERHGGWVRGTWITERRRGKLADRE